MATTTDDVPTNTVVTTLLEAQPPAFPDRAHVMTALVEVPPGALHGPGTWFAMDGLRADDARAGRLVADRDVTSVLHVADAALAAVQALDWPSGVVNVCDDEPAPGLAWRRSSAPRPAPQPRRCPPPSARRARAAPTTAARATSSAGRRAIPRGEGFDRYPQRKPVSWARTGSGLSGSPSGTSVAL